MPFINDVISTNQASIPKEHSHPRISRFTFEPEVVLQKLKQNIIGQDRTLEVIGDLLHWVKADIGNGSRPLAVCFLVGSTGVGKTETVQILSEAITGAKDKLCRIDMNTLAQEHYAASLTGAPPGYTGSKEGLTLFDKEKIQGSYSQPSVVLFDEIEKASDVVKRTLLNVMDSGFIQLAAGTQSIDFTNAILFFTSNIGTKEIAHHEKKLTTGWRLWLNLFLSSKPSEKIRESIYHSAIKKSFDPEFINRIDYILTYTDISKDHLSELLRINMEKFKRRLAKKGVTIIVEESVEEYFLTHYDEQYGARQLTRLIKTRLEPKVAKAMNIHTSEEIFVISATYHNVIVKPSLSV